MLRCFADIRVNEYIVGEGPPTLTVVVTSWYASEVQTEEDAAVAAAETLLIFGGTSGQLLVTGGIEAREKIMFIGPESDYAIEAFKVRDAWDLVRIDDGSFMVHHPWRSHWLGEDESAYRSKMFRSKVEWTLDAFKKEAVAAHNARNEKYDGRIADGTQYPRVIANASNLHKHYVETGAVNHPEGPPAREFPPACGLAVRDHPGIYLTLLRECSTLLEFKDELRGTATLNWSVDTPIANWDGVRIVGGQVMSLLLEDRGLDGTIPAGLWRKLGGLFELRLSGNNLTGCIPPELKRVATNDLDDLGLPDCAG